MPRPGLVLDVDRSTPPILFHHGESFRLEKLPPGRSRIVYPAEPLKPLASVSATASSAVRRPMVSPMEVVWLASVSLSASVRALRASESW